MKPGDILRDETKRNWQVMDARKASGSEWAWFLKPVFQNSSAVEKYGQQTGYFTVWNPDRSRSHCFKAPSEMMEWRTVARLVGRET